MLRVVALPSAVASFTVWRLCTSDSDAVFDIDTVHAPYRAAIARETAAASAPPLPSAYAAARPLARGLRYAFDPRRVAACRGGATDVCRPLAHDAATARWCARAAAAPRGPAHDALARALVAAGLTLSEAQARLGAPACHLLSTAQWASLLEGLVPARRPGGARPLALDVGAAAGDVTASLAPLFAATRALEVSPALARALEARGFRARAGGADGRVSRARLAALGLAPDDGGGFDAVFALNVVDRVADAPGFVRGLLDATAPGGALVIALPLPHYARAWRAEEEEERATADGGAAGDDGAWARRHGLAIRGDTWEAAAASAADALRRETGLPIARLARAPYISQGWWTPPWRDDGGCEPLCVLDDAIFVIRKPP